MTVIRKLTAAKEKYLRKLKHKKYRKQFGYFICEGFNTFQSAMQTEDVSIAELVIDEKRARDLDIEEYEHAPQLKHAQIYVCSQKSMHHISDDVTPPGLVFTCKSNNYTNTYLKKVDSPYLIYLDHISDPGNLGTIIRTAVWFGLKELLMSPECVDPFNSKTVRSTSGAIFKIRLITDLGLNQLTEFALGDNYKIVSTLPQGGEPVMNWIPADKCIICLGSETKGLDSELLIGADKHISIAGSGQAESLNLAVAAGIIFNRLYEFRKSTNYL